LVQLRMNSFHVYVFTDIIYLQKSDFHSCLYMINQVGYQLNAGCYNLVKTQQPTNYNQVIPVCIGSEIVHHHMTQQSLFHSGLGLSF
jgi:hypothetical protein